MKNKLMSLFLSFLMFIGCLFPNNIIAESEKEISVWYFNNSTEMMEEAEEVELFMRGELYLSAYLRDDISGNLQWQIEASKEMWIDIQGENSEDFRVTYAVVQNLLKNDSVRVRCEVNAEKTYYSDPVTVTVTAVNTQAALTTFSLERDQNAPDPLPAPVAVVNDVDDTSSTEEEISLLSDDSISLLADGDIKDEDKTFYTITIEYVYANTSKFSGQRVAIPYIAEVAAGTTLSSEIVISPNCVGYKPDIDKIDLSSFGEINGNINRTVVYSPAEVTYTVRHYQQNIDDDEYAWVDTTMVAGVTEALTSDSAAKVYEGFTALSHYHEEIAADSSTMIDIYYDRNYYLMSFELGGGHGVNPIYARYESAIKVDVPEKAGYSFVKWLDENDDAATLPNKMPAENRTFTAEWGPLGNTGYRVTYWILDPENNKKTLIGSHIEYGVSGDTVDGVDNLGTDEGTICGEELSHVHNDSCYDCNTAEHDHNLDCFISFTLEESNPGDNGIAAINDLGAESGYIYVIYNPSSGQYWPKLYLNNKYYVVDSTQGGTTTYSYSNIVSGAAIETKTDTYGNEYLTVMKYQAKTNCGSFQHVHDTSCNQTCILHTHIDSCYQDTTYLQFVEADQDVVINGDGTSVVNVYYEYKEYTLRFYYAASTGTGSNITYKIVGGTTYPFGKNGTDTSDDETLLENHYWNNSDQWGEVDELPTLNQRGIDRNYDKGSEIFTHNNIDVTFYYISFNARYGDNIANKWPCGIFNSVTRKTKNTHGKWDGTEAFVSAWNGEHHVKYSQKNSNQTIKGVYEKLDENLLFDNKFPDESTVSYLCFWENGANIDWSIPELYRYKIYVSAYSGQDTTGKESIVRNGVTYYLMDTYDTYDDSSVDSQTQVALNGYEAITFNTSRGNGYYVSALNKFEYRTLTKTSDKSLINQDGYFDSSLYREGYEVNFYYNAKKNKLSFWNYDDYLTDGTGSLVAYNEPLEKYFEGIGSYEGANDLVVKPEYYPETLEKDAYEFEGWYTSNGFEPETKVVFAQATMPDEPLMVYAHWVPVTRAVTIHLTEDRSADDTLTVSNNTFIPDENHPDVSTLVHPTDSTATFIGWFYRDEHGLEQAFDFANTPVTQNMSIYGKWRSNKMKEVEISYFVVDEKGVRTQIADTEVFMMRLGQTRTFEAKTGNSLYEGYREGCFPMTATHSITPTNDDLSSDEPIRYTFEYKKYGKVPYQVEFYVKEKDGTERPAFKVIDGKTVFVNSDTFNGWTDDEKTAFINSNGTITSGGTLAEGGKYIEQHWENNKAIVTELYVPDVEDLSDSNWSLPDEYLPNAIKIQKVIVPSATDPETNIAANIIKFVYEIKDSIIDPGNPGTPMYESKYLVQHYVQSTADLNTFELYSFSNETGYSGQVATAAPISVLGHTFNWEVTNSKKQAYTNLAADNVMSGTITADDKLELNFYYTVNSYPYQVMYLEEDSNRVLATTKTHDSGGNLLKGYYGSKVTENAIDIEGYKVVGDATKTIYIQMEADDQKASVNTIVFYYALKSSELILSKKVELDPTQAAQEGISEIPDWVYDQKFVFTVEKKDGYPKSVYHYTHKDKNGISTEKTVNAELTTFEIELKNGEQVQIHELPPGNYYVSETYVPGFRISVGGVMAGEYYVDLQNDGMLGKLEFLNTFPFYTGDLAVMKNVSKLDPSDPTATEPFKVTVVIKPSDEAREVDRIISFVDGEGNPCKDYYGHATYTIPKLTGIDDQKEFTIDLLVPVDGEIKLKDVPVGDFIATEEAKGTIGYIYDFFKVKYNKAVHIDDEVTGTSHTVSGEIHGGHPTAVTFNNTYKKGSLTINKTVIQEYVKDSWEKDTFTFTINGTTELPDGPYTILVDGATETVNVQSGKVHLVKNLYIEKTGDESVTSWTKSLSIQNLPAGYYTVTETAGLGNDKYTASVVCEPDTGLVNDTANPSEFNFTNIFNRTKGNLQVGKEIVLVNSDVILDKDASFDFEVNLKDTDLDQTYECVIKIKNETPELTDDAIVPGSETSLTPVDGVLKFSLKHHQYILIKGLPVGDYLVKELKKEGYDSSFGDVTLGSNYSVDPATIVTNETEELVCQNAYPVYYAHLIVQKTVVTPDDLSDIDKAPEDDIFKFEVSIFNYSSMINPTSVLAIYYDSDGNETTVTALPLTDNTLTFELKHGEKIALNLPAGNYTVTETGLSSTVHTDNDLSKHYEVSCLLGETVGTNSMTSGLLAGETETVVFTNTYLRHYGDLKIVKTNAVDTEQVFVYEIADVNQPGNKYYVTITGNSSTTIHDLPLGTYTITQKNDWSWRYDSQVDVAGSQDICLEKELSTSLTEAAFGQGEVNKRWVDDNSELWLNRREKA